LHQPVEAHRPSGAVCEPSSVNVKLPLVDVMMARVGVDHGCERLSVHCTWNCALGEAVHFSVVPPPDAVMLLNFNCGRVELVELP
jgi:hypothetical protein